MLTQEQRVRIAAETLVKQATIASRKCGLSDSIGAASLLEHALCMAVARMAGVSPSPDRVMDAVRRTTSQIEKDIPLYVLAGYAALEIKIK